MKTSLTLKKLDIQEVPLSNGSLLYYRHIEEAPRTALGIYTFGGNRVESTPGVADMIDDLLCEGTHKRSAEQIALEMDGLSLEMETDTRRDFNLMSATFLEEDLEPSMELLADMLFHSTLADFEKEKIRLHGELVMDLDSPRSRSHDLLMTHLFRGTPYQATHSNILAAIPALQSPEPLLAHYKNFYQPANMLFCVVGSVELPTIQTQLESYFNRSAGENHSGLNAPSPPAPAERRYVTYAKEDSNQLHIFKGWFAPNVSHADYPAMVVLNTILGGAGLTSRLFIELRDKQGLAYMVRSQYESSKYVGAFTLYIGTDPANREKVLKGFELECQKLMEHPVGYQELDEAKENIMGRRVVFLETAPQQCSYIGNQVSLGVSLEELNAIPERVQAVTALQVQEVAQKYLSRPAVIAAVGPSHSL